MEAKIEYLNIFNDEVLIFFTRILIREYRKYYKIWNYFNNNLLNKILRNNKNLMFIF